jgi:hypothetical protein
MLAAEEQRRGPSSYPRLDRIRTYSYVLRIIRTDKTGLFFSHKGEGNDPSFKIRPSPELAIDGGKCTSCTRNEEIGKRR